MILGLLPVHVHWSGSLDRTIVGSWHLIFVDIHHVYISVLNLVGLVGRHAVCMRIDRMPPWGMSPLALLLLVGGVTGGLLAVLLPVTGGSVGKTPR